MDDGLVPDMFSVCFWQVVDPDINNTFVYLDGNIAPITGYEIYSGTITYCINLSTYEEQMTSEKTFCVITCNLYPCIFI